MTKIIVEYFEIGSRREIPESDIGDTGGLERFFGFQDYKKGIRHKTIPPGAEILVPRGFTCEGDVKYRWESYFALDEKTLKHSLNLGGFSLNPKEKLQGIHWYVKK